MRRVTKAFTILAFLGILIITQLIIPAVIISVGIVILGIGYEVIVAIRSVIKAYFT